MADATMKDFLLHYYKLMRFKQMPPEVAEQFESYRKTKDFTGHMKDWDKEFYAGDDKIEFPSEIMPGDGYLELSDDEAKQLFNTFQSTFQKMYTDNTLNPAAKQFVDSWYSPNGTDHLFNDGVASKDTDDALESFVAQVESDENLRTELEYNDVFDKIKWENFIQGIKDKKYNTDLTFRAQVQDVVGQFHRAVHELGYSHPGYNALARSARSIANQVKNKFSNSGWNENMAGTSPAMTRGEYFRKNYRRLLNPLFENKKVFEGFQSHDGGEITSQVAKAREEVDFANKSSADYVSAKAGEKLSLPKQVEKWVGDNWSDAMGKYSKLRGDRLYFSDRAKAIVKALDSKGVGFKPTDGLGVLLEKSGAIESAIGDSPKTKEHFKWLIETLEPLKKKKMFDGALQNGRQMRALVEEVIMAAMKNPEDAKLEEAKTAMEVLSVIKYGYTTSKVMDAFSQTDFKIFSADGLSWNKNEGMAMVTRALDASIKGALVGIGYAITATGNAIRLHNGRNFHGNTMGKTFQQAVADEQARLDAAYDDASGVSVEERARRDALYKTEKADREAEITALTADGADVAHRDATKAGLKSRIATAETKMMDASTSKDILDNKMERTEQAAARAQERYTQANDVITTFDSENAELADIPNRIAHLRDVALPELSVRAAALGSTITPAVQFELDGLKDERKNILDEIATLTARQTELTEKLKAGGDAAVAYDNAKSKIGAFGRAVANVQRVYDETKIARGAAQSNVDTAKTELDGANRDRTGFEDKVSKFDAGVARIKELQEHIAALEKEASKADDDKRNKYKELMAYWDYLEGGGNTHTGFLNLKNIFTQGTFKTSTAEKEMRAGFDASWAAYRDAWEM